MVKRAEGALLQAIQIDRTAPQTLSVQICSGLRDLIVNRVLQAGQRLPATRTLAKEFGVARSTIVEAFDQLTAEGLLETRVGAGTYVSGTLDTERPVVPASAGATNAAPSAAFAARPHRFAPRLAHELRPFTTAMPAFDAFPMAQWSRLFAKHWRKPRSHVLGYPEPAGFTPLRQAIAAHLRSYRGIECDWRHIFITAGAQQAFQLIAGTLVEPGDYIWFENPGAIGARNSLMMSRGTLVPVPVDDAGLVVAEGLVAAPRFKLAFVTPSHQQPLGTKMSLERRFALLRAAEASGAWVVEDDWDGEFCFSERPLPALKSIDSGGHVIYVGTFSKCLFPSLRLGFLLAPPNLAAHLQEGLEAFSPGVPTALQAVVADFIVEGHLATHIRRMRKLYAERYQVLVEEVEAHLSAWLEIIPTTTGMHTVAFLKPGLDAERVAGAADVQGLTVAPISRFCIEPIERQGLVLGFSGFTKPQIQAGVQALRRILAQDAGATASTGRHAAE